jgi:hypothetical protein
MRNPKRNFFSATTGAMPLVLLGFLLVSLARAELKEPDNVLYGTITLDNVPITAARTDVVVEARRLTNGPAIASYRMGSNSRLGDFYALELRLESLTPVSDAAASQTGESLLIVVRDMSGLRGQTTYTLGERGQVQRVDLGTALPDSDNDGLPDSWEQFHFGNLDQNGGSMSLNGWSVLQNFISGTDPFSTNGFFKLNISVSNNLQIVSFLARRAEGAGYEGRSRLYSLETATNLAAISWTGVAPFTNVAGDNQTVLFQTTSTNAPVFYRSKVWLQPP